MNSLKKIKHKTKQRGFTIVELLIVIVVIAILAAITIVAYNGIQTRARDSGRAADIATLQKVLEIYHADKGGYPNCAGGAYRAGDARAACLTSYANFISTLSPSYVSTVPKDPLSTGSYQYWYACGSKKSGSLSYAADFSDNYVLAYALQSQGGPYLSATQPTYNFNVMLGSSN